MALFSELHGNNGLKKGLQTGLQEAPSADPSELYSLPAELPDMTKTEQLDEEANAGYQVHRSLSRG